jgi:hypothetical protein
MRAGIRLALVVCAGCSAGERDDDTGTIPAVDLTACESGEAPEVFLGTGVGGAFQPLEEGAALGLSAAPQGGFGVSVLVGTRALLAGADQTVSAELTAESGAVENSAATFTLEAILDCKADGPDGAQGVIYGVVVGFNSSLGNSDLLAMNAQPADLTVTVTDATGATATVVQTVSLIVGE